jgi:hypothetical protein
MSVVASPNAVVVNISDTLQPVKRAEFNRSLILGDTPGNDVLKDTYRVYQSMEQVSEDYPVTSAEYKVAHRIFSQIPRPRDVAIYSINRVASEPKDPTELSEALNHLLNEKHTGWYFLVPAIHDEADQLEIADWITSQRRMAIMGCASGEDVDTIVDRVTAMFQSRRVYYCAHKDNDDNWMEGAVAGYAGGNFPGSVAWFHSKLQGLQNTDFTFNELVTLEQANVAAWWETPIGIWAGSGGQAINGFWADLTHAIDFLEATIKEHIWDLLVQRGKVPYTDEGILMLANRVREVLHRCAGAPYHIIATDLDRNPLCRVMPPRRVDIDPLEVKNRNLPDLPFIATVEGAIKSVTVNGILTEEVISPEIELYGETARR